MPVAQKTKSASLGADAALVAEMTLRGAVLGTLVGAILYPLLGTVCCGLLGNVILTANRAGEASHFNYLLRLLWIGLFFILCNAAFFAVFSGWTAFRARRLRRMAPVLRLALAALLGGLAGWLVGVVYFRWMGMPLRECTAFLGVFAAAGLAALALGEIPAAMRPPPSEVALLRRFCRRTSWGALWCAVIGCALLAFLQETLIPDISQTGYVMLLFAQTYAWLLWTALCYFGWRNAAAPA